MTARRLADQRLRILVLALFTGDALLMLCTCTWIVNGPR